MRFIKFTGYYVFYTSLIFCVNVLSVSAQENYSDNFTRLGLRIYSGFIIAHAHDVENTAGSLPLAIDLEYSKRHTGQDMWNLCRCYPTTGFVLSYKNYDNKILGHGFGLSYFIQYHFFQNTRINPVIRGTSGLEYNTNPHHQIHNPDNQSYSLPINAFLQLSAGLDIRLNDNLFLDLSVGFNHISNGGLSQPNRGINWPSGIVGVYYSPNYNPPTSGTESVDLFCSDNRWQKRLEINLSAISKTFDEKERFSIIGSEFIAGYRLNNLNTLLGGLEWNLDMSAVRRIEYNNLSKNPNRLSILAGHEFFMGSFRFSQKIGVYLYDELKLNDAFYHKWGMLYFHKSGLFTGVELKAHKHVAEFVCLKLGYDF